MPTKFRKSLLSLGIAGVAFAGLYSYARPNWRLLNESEMRSALKLELQQAKPVDLAAQSRYRRFLKFASQLGYDQGVDPHSAEKIRGLIRRGSPEIQALERIVFQGPLQIPDREYFPRSFEPMYLAVNLAEIFAGVARSQAVKGDTRSAARNYRIAIGLAEQISNVSTSWVGLDNQSHTYESIDRELFQHPIVLTEPELGDIARAIPPSSLEDSEARRLLLMECQMLFSALVDPIEWTRKTMPEEKDPERMLTRLTSGNFFGEEDSGAVLTYDARETAEHLNRIVPVALANTGRSFRDQDHRMDHYGARLTASYPTNGAAGKTGAMFWFKRMEYRWATARVRNGLGQRMIEMLSQGYASYPLVASFFRRALRESIRTRIALRRYRLRYGRPAPDLAELVHAKLLDKLPLDPYSGATLCYDPKRNLLWGVGENGKDDNGSALLRGSRSEPDIVWQAL